MRKRTLYGDSAIVNECVFSCRADYATRDYVIGMLHVKLTKCSGFLRSEHGLLLRIFISMYTEYLRLSQILLR